VSSKIEKKNKKNLFSSYSRRPAFICRKLPAFSNTIHTSDAQSEGTSGSSGPNSASAPTLSSIYLNEPTEVRRICSSE